MPKFSITRDTDNTLRKFKFTIKDSDCKKLLTVSANNVSEAKTKVAAHLADKASATIVKVVDENGKQYVGSQLKDFSECNDKVTDAGIPIDKVIYKEGPYTLVHETLKPNHGMNRYWIIKDYRGEKVWNGTAMQAVTIEAGKKDIHNYNAYNRLEAKYGAQLVHKKFMAGELDKEFILDENIDTPCCDSENCDTDVTDSTPIYVDKVIYKDGPYSLVQEVARADAKLPHYWVIRNYNNEKEWKFGGTLVLSIDEGKHLIKSYNTMDHLNAKYGKSLGYKKWMAGETDSDEKVTDAANFYMISFIRNNVHQAIMVNANSEADAVRKFTEKKEDAEYVGIRPITMDEVSDYKLRGMSIIDAASSDAQPDCNNAEEVKDFKSTEKTNSMDLAAAIRANIKEELTAIDDYSPTLSIMDDLGKEEMATVIRHIVKEERKHVGELYNLLNMVDNEELSEFNAGIEESTKEVGVEDTDTTAIKDISLLGVLTQRDLDDYTRYLANDPEHFWVREFEKDIRTTEESIKTGQQILGKAKALLRKYK